MNAYSFDTGCSERSDVRDAERGACGKNRLAGMKVFTAPANVAVRITHVVNRDRASPIVRVFMTNHSIGALRDGRAGHHAHRFAGFNPSIWKCTGCNLSNHFESCAGSIEVTRADGVAIHRRIVPWRRIDRGNGGFGQHPMCCVACRDWLS